MPGDLGIYIQPTAFFRSGILTTPGACKPYRISTMDIQCFHISFPIYSEYKP